MNTSHIPTTSAPEASSCTKRHFHTLLRTLALVMAVASWVAPAWAVQQNWAGPGGTTANPTSGIWDTNTPNWNAGVIFTNNNGAVLGGADGTYFIQCLTNLNVTNLTFSASGYTLTNDQPRTIGAPNANASVIVAAGKTGTIGTNVTVSGSGNPFLFNPGAVSAGTLIIDNGGTLQQSANQAFNFDGAPGSTIRILTGGTLRHGGNGSNIRLGLTANSSPTVSVEGGNFVCNGGSSFGSIILTAANSTTSTVTIVSGMVSNSFLGNAANGSLNLGNGSPSLATVNLNGGIMALGNIRKTTAAATGVLNLNGGTLKAATGSSGSTFLPALSGATANVRNNTSTIDNGGFSITIGQPLVHSTIGGDNAIDGGLAFAGSGTTILTPTNTYTGQTLINSGTTLSLGSSGVINSSSALNIGGTLSLSNQLYANAAGSFSMSNGVMSVTTINFPTNIVTGTLATGGTTNTINFTAIVGAGSPPFPITVIKYSSLAAGVVDGGNNLTTLGVGSLPAGITGFLTNNVTKNSIDLMVTGGSFPPPVTDPASVTRYKGYNVQFSVTAIGATGFQWQTNNGAGWVNLLDGGNISGAGTNVLTLTAVTLAQAGSYRVLATNSVGSSTSGVATLTVLDTIGYGGTNALLTPVAYYRLNETGDPINTPNLPAYDFVGGIDGTYSTNALNAAYGIVGPQSPAFPGFEANNAAAEMTRGYAGSWVAVSNAWPINTNTATILAWVKPADGQTNFAGIVVQRGGSAASFGLTYSGSTNASGNFTLGYNWNNDGNAFGWDSGLVPPIGQWSMVVLVVTPTNATIYVGNTNGLASSVHVLNHAVQSSPGPFYLGADPFALSRTFNGDVDEVAIFNRALTQNEIFFSLLASAVGTTNFAPTITTQPPAGVANFQYQQQQIAVQAFGSGTLSYDWQKGTNGVFVDVVNDSRISGAGTTALSISNLDLSDSADYQVIVANNTGSTTSIVSHLTVNPVLGPATNITTAVVSAAGNDWDTAVTWSINGTPQNESATLLAEEYSSGPGQGSTFIILPACGLRTPALNNPNSPTTSTFPGDVLVVQGNGSYDPNQTGAAGNIRIKGGNPATVNFKKLVMAGGQLSSILNSGWPAIIGGGEVNVISNTVIWASDDTNPRAITIQSQLTGNGNIIYHAYNTFTTFQAGSSASLNIANPNNTYTGTWDVLLGSLVGSAPNALGTNTIIVEAQGALQTTYDINNMNADLILNGRMFLTQNDTFRKVTVNGMALSAGSHSFAELNASFPAIFPATWTALNGATNATTGSGSLTVQVGASQPGNIQVGPGGPTGFQLTWTNSSTLLLSATNLPGPWVTNTGATSPYPLTNNAPQMFFRLLGQ